MLPRMLTSGQIRAARALLGLRQVDLASKAGVAEVTLKTVEHGAGDPRLSTLTKIRGALEAAGIEFMVGGVRLKSSE